MVVDGLTRIFKLDYKLLPQKVKYCFKDNLTQRIFRMEEEDIFMVMKKGTK